MSDIRLSLRKWQISIERLTEGTAPETPTLNRALVHAYGSREARSINTHDGPTLPSIQYKPDRIAFYLLIAGPWQRLNFKPLPQGHGSLRPVCFIASACSTGTSSSPPIISESLGYDGALV